ncbi:aminoglycoside phosphotransferase [Salipaludibacillus keqinensis]|uniref:Aminoglycoside phosphotransferase n=1 Tax=Salipaludibacillus keqinensis TaxID=2045207 RepID=A0A323TFX1_9BACI|nr:phosphotransferase [Salipaludibacillus keqinensis]PYZ93390.1 aminoglycoside phosphotransferase [Salipaludibacillus keqinensis]
MSDFSKEEKLSGGNVSDVYRSGNTVRRELKSDSSKVHQLLNHLEKKGFEFAPKFLGIDDKGREILSYIEGEAGNYPLKNYMWSDQVLSEIAKMLRLYHDAVSDFPGISEWKALDGTPQSFEVLCHNDFAIYNIIFNHKKPMGIIDFDVAGPGPRIWDIAYTLYTCVPLSRFYLSESEEKIYYDSATDAARVKKRIQLFFDSYGMDIPPNLLDVVILRLEGLCKTIKRNASEGNQAFQKMIEEGHVRHYQEDISFIREYGSDWENT